MNATNPPFEHENYEELCALATAGVLTPAQSEILHAHLADCAECREVFAQYQSIASDGMPFLADHFAAPQNENVDTFDESSALTRLMEATEPATPRLVPMPEPKSKPRYWRQALLRGLIAASLLFGVSLVSYRIGWVRSKAVTASSVNAPLTSALDQAASEKKTLDSTIQTDSRRLTDLEQQVASSKAEVEKYLSEAEAASANLSTATASFTDSKSQSDAQIATLTQERDTSAARLHDAENMYRTVQDELNTLRGQHQQDLIRMASLEIRVDSLAVALNDQNARAKNDEQYLSSDKDIRDLIGARNLLISDIMDVNETGQRKPFGRIFYTKTKSLIFYAYDLDRQPGVRQTSTFQVWGRTSARDRNPVNLGILYMDSETNKRWTLRVDNPQQLAQLDSVFVTIEPRVQTERPTGKPFLQASLRRDPNHP